MLRDCLDKVLAVFFYAAFIHLILLMVKNKTESHFCTHLENVCRSEIPSECENVSRRRYRFSRFLSLRAAYEISGHYFHVNARCGASFDDYLE